MQEYHTQLLYKKKLARISNDMQGKWGKINK
jgi:hypothetical protein